MILIDGIVSVETPVHPQTMLAKVRDMIHQIEKPADLVKEVNNSQECVIQEFDNGLNREVCK